MTVLKLAVLYLGIYKQSFKTLLIHHRILIFAVISIAYEALTTGMNPEKPQENDILKW